MSEHILRIPRSDSEEDFVLVQITSRSSSNLDLKLVATEGEVPYVGSLKGSQIGKLRAKTYKGSDEEWSNILSHVFLQREPSTDSSEGWKSGLEVVAAVKSGDEDEKEIVITFRKRIDSITQRLGAVTLKQDDDQAIQLFDWTGTAVGRANDLANEITNLKAKYRQAEETIHQLTSQLEDLIQAKNEHEDQLIAKFAKLLNEKKLKIRNQQRLLATAKIDSEKLAQLEAADAGKKHRKPDASRKSKRKAEEELPTESQSEDSFDTMEVDTKAEDEVDNEATASEPERESTPQPLEDETASEDEEEIAAPSSPPPSKKSDSTSKQEENEAPSQSASQRVPPTRSPRAPAARPTSSPPPRRELPFARRKANPPPAKEPAPESGDGTTSDDEL
ncbi:hypothetical protein VTO42DRAFT_4654 [Malbranchea cinnamomea]